jgi:hypothetical protein
LVAALPEEKTKCWNSVTNGNCQLDPAGKRGTQAYTHLGENFQPDYNGDPDEWQGGKNCEPAEVGEEVSLAYSIDNGTTWVQIMEFPVDKPMHTYILPVPLEAQTTHTQFRWKQRNHSSMPLGDVRGSPVLWYPVSCTFTLCLVPLPGISGVIAICLISGRWMTWS